MSEKRMIIRNCPAFDEGDCASPTEHIPYATACEHIEDCKLKQIVELCKDVKLTYSKLDKPLTATQCTALFSRATLADEILKLLDIQEAECEESKTIKRSECPYGGIDCAWCTEDCE